MKVVLQRVKEAHVHVDGRCVGAIERGLLLLVGFTQGDHEALIDPVIQKIIGLRVFEEGDKGFHLSLMDVGGELLVVSQFTLYADCRKGRRPSFTGAMDPEQAKGLYDRFVIKCCEAVGEKRVSSGIFGAHMEVGLINDGPVTLIIESESDQH